MARFWKKLIRTDTTLQDPELTMDHAFTRQSRTKSVVQKQATPFKRVHGSFRSSSSNREGGGAAMAEEGGESEITLEHTPTWIVTLVCTVIVFISFVFERLLHRLGKVLKRKNQKPLFDALQKIKEELMLLGFISLLLVVLQGSIQRICISENLTHHLRPCKGEATATSTAHYVVSSSGRIVGGARRLLSGGGDSTYCQKKVSLPKFL
ncbi:hypothetical protein ZIOFF_064586 [Zingiber officinale]|uniref:Uncharacterized protein n=1 Tax=Zingiber officinale TaxID=94328 RepID=A0A8J5KCP2_ZINOF|nr:hypothetical protein ZIOFF_064586 [Zingiber officinale]